MQNDNIEMNNYDYYELDGLKNYNNEINKISVLSKEEEQDLARKAKSGDVEAKQKFIEANLRLVRYIALKYRDRGVDMDDLIQEGNIGLMKAVEKFDPDKEFCFSTYATNWIKSFIQNAIVNYSGVIKKSPYVVNNILTYNKKVDELAKSLNHMPNKYEISEALGISLKEIDQINLLQRKTISLDNPLKYDGDTEISELVADPNIDVENEVLSKLTVEDIKEMFKSDCLTKNEIITLYHLCGFDDHNPKSQADIARMLNVTRTRISQIVGSASKKICKNEEPASNNKKLEYKFDAKSKRMLKKVRVMMQKDEYTELELAIIKARENKALDLVSMYELIILLLSLGFVKNKEYAPIEISYILCIDHNSIVPIISGVLDKYKNIILASNEDKTLNKKLD